MKKLLLVIMLALSCQASFCQSAFDKMVAKYTKQTSIVANVDVTGKDLAKDAKTAGEKEIANKINRFRMFIIETKRLFPSFKADFATIEKSISSEDGKAVWEEAKAEIADLKQKIIDGTITIVNAQEGEILDPSTCPNVNIK